jgi:hypothetical protein
MTFTDYAVQTKGVLTKIITFVVIIVVLVVLFRIAGNFLSAATTPLAVDASMRVMEGNSSTVEGMAVQSALGGTAGIFHTTTKYALLLMIVAFLTYLSKHLYNFYVSAKPKKEEEVKHE